MNEEFWIFDNGSVEKPVQKEKPENFSKWIHVREILPNEPDYKKICLELLDACQAFANAESQLDDEVAAMKIIISLGNAMRELGMKII
jgi:hypothetical protein